MGNRSWLASPQYGFIVPSQAVGASKVFFDLFNANSASSLLLEVVKAVKDGSVAVTGVVSVALYLTRTTAVGTGGTAYTAETSSLTLPSIFDCAPSGTDPANVSLRAAPAGGATGGAVLARRDSFAEETNAANYSVLDFLDPFGSIAPIIIPPNTGVRVIQGAIASVGNLSFEGRFEIL